MPQTTKTATDENTIVRIVKEYGILTLATLLMAFGIYLFRFPNNFSFGGVTGIAVILAPFLPISASTLTLILNVALLILGLVVLGGSFGIKTVYVTLLLSGALSLAEILYPMDAPLTTSRCWSWCLPSSYRPLLPPSSSTTTHPAAVPTSLP